MDRACAAHGQQLPPTFNSCSYCTWAPEGRHKRGRPRETRRRAVERKCRIEGSEQGCLEEHNFQPYSPHKDKEIKG